MREIEFFMNTTMHPVPAETGLYTNIPFLVTMKVLQKLRQYLHMGHHHTRGWPRQAERGTLRQHYLCIVCCFELHVCGLRIWMTWKQPPDKSLRGKCWVSITIVTRHISPSAPIYAPLGLRFSLLRRPDPNLHFIALAQEENTLCDTALVSVGAGIRD